MKSGPFHVRHSLREYLWARMNIEDAEEAKKQAEPDRPPELSGRFFDPDRKASRERRLRLLRGEG